MHGFNFHTLKINKMDCLIDYQKVSEGWDVNIWTPNAKESNNFCGTMKSLPTAKAIAYGFAKENNLNIIVENIDTDVL